MLKITTDGRQLDLSPETEVTLVFENPMMTEDGIPAPYSLSYELPLSPRNREILGYPDRPTSNEGFKTRSAEITWGAMVIASGQQTIEEVSNVITANFNAARFPPDVRKHIHNAIRKEVTLGYRKRDDTPRPGSSGSGGSTRPEVLSSGGSRWGYDSNEINAEYDSLLRENAKTATCRDIVAPPIAILGNSWPEYDDERGYAWNGGDAYYRGPTAYANGVGQSGGYISTWGGGSSRRLDGSVVPSPTTRNEPFYQLRASFINAFTEEKGYKCSDTVLGKILPTFHVGWMLDMLLAGYISNNIFSTTDWAQLRLLCTWHHKYQIADQSPIYSVEATTDRVFIEYSEFLPSVTGTAFIKEILRLPCASLFIRGDSYNIELNKAILARNIVHDWSGKVMDIPTKTVERGKEYVCGYSSDYGSVPADRVIVEVDTINDMFIHAEQANGREELATYRIKTTGQVIESIFDTDSTARCKFNVVEQNMGGKATNEAVDEDDDGPEQFENTFSGEVLATNLRRYFLEDHKWDDENPKLRRFFYCPEMAPVQGATRPDKLVVGLYWGMRNNLVKDTAATPMASYPYMSHTNHDAYGNRLGDLTLQFNTPDGLMEHYHKEFKAWVERDKHMLKASVHITAQDIQSLDMRDKYWIDGVKYLLRSLSVTLKVGDIADAEAEFIEVPDVL